MEKIYYVDENETRTVLGVESAIWDNPEKTSITCKILFKEFALTVGFMPYTASKFDSVAVGREIFNDIKNEVWGLVEEYKAPDTEEQLPEV